MKCPLDKWEERAAEYGSGDMTEAYASWKQFEKIKKEFQKIKLKTHTKTEIDGRMFNIFKEFLAYNMKPTGK